MCLFQLLLMSALVRERDDVPFFLVQWEKKPIRLMMMLIELCKESRWSFVVAMVIKPFQAGANRERCSSVKAN